MGCRLRGVVTGGCRSYSLQNTFTCSLLSPPNTKQLPVRASLSVCASVRLLTASGERGCSTILLPNIAGSSMFCAFQKPPRKVWNVFGLNIEKSQYFQIFRQARSRCMSEFCTAAMPIFLGGTEVREKLSGEVWSVYLAFNPITTKGGDFFHFSFLYPSSLPTSLPLSHIPSVSVVRPCTFMFLTFYVRLSILSKESGKYFLSTNPERLR